MIGDDERKTMDMLTRAKTTRGEGARAQMTFWTRTLHAKAVVTACRGAHSGTRPAKQCLGACPSWGGCNCGGSLVKSDMVKWQLTPEVYCSKLDRVLLLNRDVIGSNGVVWEVEVKKDLHPGNYGGVWIKI